MQILFIWRTPRRYARTASERIEEVDRFYRDAPGETAWAWIVRQSAIAQGLAARAMSLAVPGRKSSNECQQGAPAPRARIDER